MSVFILHDFAVCTIVLNFFRNVCSLRSFSPDMFRLRYGTQTARISLLEEVAEAAVTDEVSEASFELLALENPEDAAPDRVDCPGCKNTEAESFVFIELPSMVTTITAARIVQQARTKWLRIKRITIFSSFLSKQLSKGAMICFSLLL